MLSRCFRILVSHRWWGVSSLDVFLNFLGDFWPVTHPFDEMASKSSQIDEEIGRHWKKNWFVKYLQYY